MNRQVLLVDDEPKVLQAYYRLLHTKFDVHTAASGLQAFEIMARQGPFAVIVSDYQMPVMNGIEFLSRVRCLSPNSIRIMLTGQGDMQTAIAAINDGAVFRFLTKPCSNENMQTTLNEAVEQYNFIYETRSEADQAIIKHSQKTMLRNSIDAISLMLSKRDAYTAEHQFRVAALATAIASKMGICGEQMDSIYTAARVHDIGKVFIPADILTRPGRISDIEFMLIQTHSKNGYEILKLLDFYQPIAEIVLQHHERLNGTGYPQGLKGEEIMIEARILAVADVMEAMHSHRPYRPAIGESGAIQELLDHRGTLYDEAAVDACWQVFKVDGFAFQ